MKIPLTKGYFAEIDDEDAVLVAGRKWRVHVAASGHKYAHSGKRPNLVLMHRLIFGLTGKEIADHADGDGLNNRRSNLRRCTYAQNCYNRRKNPNQSSRYKGVTRHRGGKWQAQLQTQGRPAYLGLFESEEAAAMAYNQAALAAFGDFACLNQGLQ